MVEGCVDVVTISSNSTSSVVVTGGSSVTGAAVVVALATIFAATRRFGVGIKAECDFIAFALSLFSDKMAVGVFFIFLFLFLLLFLFLFIRFFPRLRFDLAILLRDFLGYFGKGAFGLGLGAALSDNIAVG